MRFMTTLAGMTCAALLSCLFALCAVAKPAHVIIVVPPGAAPPTGFADQLATWRQSGQISSALLLVSYILRDVAYGLADPRVRLT